MNAILEYINITGHWFVEHAFAVLIQSSLLIVILLLADLLLRRKVRAVFRYWIWMLVLAKLILPGSLTSPVSLGHLVGDRLQLVNIAAIEEKTRAKQSQSQTTPPLLIWPMTEKLTNTTAGSSLPFTEPFLGTAEPTAESVVTRSVNTPTAPAIFTTTMVALTWQGIIFVIWLIVVLTMALLVLQRAMFIKGLVRQASAANRLMNEELQYCRERMRVRCKVDLKVSVNATSPAVCGLFRPVILLPRNLGPTLGSSHLRTVLMHELAHVKRGDLWINMLQAALQIVYFYNPLLWFANAIIRRVREQAVDETVLVAMGPRAQQYPETLLNVARLAFARPALSLRLIGVVESKSQLKERIRKMLDRPIPKTAKLGIAGMLVVFALGAFLLPMAKADDGVADSFVVRKQPKAKTEAEINTLQEQIERLLEQLQSLRQQIKQQEQQAKLPEEPQELVEQVDEIERSEQMHQWQQGEDMQKWQEEIKNWQNSDEFRQWQEQMERWTKDNAKAFGKAEQNLRRAKELNPSPAPAPSPMPVMPSIPPMPPMPQIPLEVRPSPEQISKSMPHVEPPKETIRQLQKIVTEKIALEQEIRKLHAELKQKQQLGNISDHEVEDLNDKIGALEQKLERVSDHSEELAEQIEDWGDEVGERVTVWSEELREKFEQQYENRHEEGLEQHEQQMEHFGHQMEQWSEQFAGQMEQWAEQFSSGIEMSLEKLKDELDVIDEATDEITDESQDDGDKVIFRKNPDEFTITLAKGKQIVVNNQVGSIELHRGQAGQLKGTAAVRAKADTMNLAKQMAEQVKMQVDEDDKTLTLTVIKSGKQNWKGLNVDLDIQVPQNVKIKVKNNIGNVKISGLEGKIECTTNVGNIDADSLQGKIRLVTDVGKIYYDAPDDISAVVKASANVGSIVTDLPLDVKKSGFTASKATGTLGAGDDKIELVTQVGSISVR